MRILGIETSCDETAIAVVDDGVHVRSNVISSSQALFESLAGVIPEEAARKQIECMIPVLNHALEEAKTSWEEIEVIAVTRGPGLLGSLLIGTVTARLLGAIKNIPVIGVHHTLGHLSSTWLDAGDDVPEFPALTLSASGGHTDLWYRTSPTKGQLLGRTRDDAAGEAFDKGASMLGLLYPGGPSIAKMAEQGDMTAHTFPQPLVADDTLDFSFSGLKTSLKYLLRDLGTELENQTKSDVSASFQHAICKHLLSRIELSLDRYRDVHEVHIVGGVSANKHLRELAKAMTEQKGIRLRVPATLGYCTDNGAMIASAGYFLKQELGNAAFSEFDTKASLPLDETVKR